jgi:hypothetical protein
VACKHATYIRTSGLTAAATSKPKQASGYCTHRE